MAVFCWISSTSEDWGVKKGTYLTNIWGVMMSRVKIHSEKWFSTWNGVPSQRKTTSQLKASLKKRPTAFLEEISSEATIDFEGWLFVSFGEGISLFLNHKHYWIYGFITLQQICIP